MKSKCVVAWILAAVIPMFSGIASAIPTGNGLQAVISDKLSTKQGHGLPISAKDGTGPVCWPGIGCGYQ